MNEHSLINAIGLADEKYVKEADILHQNIIAIQIIAYSIQPLGIVYGSVALGDIFLGDAEIVFKEAHVYKAAYVLRERINGN